MIHFDAPPLHRLVMALTAIIILFVIWAFIRIINSQANTLQWWHLISTKGATGEQWLSWDPIGKGLGVVLCFWLPTLYAYSPKMEAMGLAAVMGVALAYLGGVSGYAAMLRSRQGVIETTRVTELAPSKTVTDTKVETPPITQGPKA